MNGPKKKAAISRRGPSSEQPVGVVAGERELIVVARAERSLRVRAESVASSIGADVDSLAKVLAEEKVSLVPLFGPSEEHVLRAAARAPGAPVEEMARYYRIGAPDERLDELAARLAGQPEIEAAFVKPAAEPAIGLNDMAPSAVDAPPVTPDFTARQIYLNGAPAGIDARFAWTKPGGSGAGVRIIDIEGAWRFTHEDLAQNQGGLVGGTHSPEILWRNHGTAVIGEFSGDRNSIGVTGICPEANVRAVSIFGPGSSSAGAIRRAADLLDPGDIILIELHRAGPRFNFTGRSDQLGYIAIEWWPDDFAAIRYATSRGVIVVEAAGNGAENLDVAIYYDRPAGFPTTWLNPFGRAQDSGAIIVGAGAPPPGTHGRDHGSDRSRLDFSNFGACVDTQGWGREVTTCGYGDLQGGGSEDLWYTDTFSGTSSASPIVVGALANIQGFLRARGIALLNPATARALLRTTGSPQQDAPGRPASERIGNRPDLRAMIDSYLSGPVSAVPLYRYWNPGIADHFYTTNWSELGGGRYGWGYEGIQCYVLAQQHPGSVPLYRYWNAGAGDHFYTTNWNELGTGRYGWVLEGIQCYVYAAQIPGTVPLYRYWNPGGTDHFYTTNWNELGTGRYGWGYEGIQCQVFTQPVTPPSEGSPENPEIALVGAAVGPTMSAEEGLEATLAGEVVPSSFRMEGGTGLAAIPATFTVLAASEKGGAATPASFQTFGTV